MLLATTLNNMHIIYYMFVYQKALIPFFRLQNKLCEFIAPTQKGPVTIPTIAVLGRKVRSNLVSINQFFVLIPNLASDLPYVAYFGGLSTSKFGLPALFERLAFRLQWMTLSMVNGNSLSLDVTFTLYSQWEA